MTEEGSGGAHVAARGEGRELFIGTLQVSAEQSDPLEVSEGKSPTGPCRLTFAPPQMRNRSSIPRGSPIVPDGVLPSYSLTPEQALTDPKLWL